MKCPLDQTTLVMSDRHGIEIDYCPECRGVWLDRGELDKIIDRAPAESARPAEPQRYESDGHYDDRRSDSHYDDRRQDPRGKRKREGFLGDLFDFGD
jgi:Zn-finger nucleic acid-binding protein